MYHNTRVVVSVDDRVSVDQESSGLTLNFGTRNSIAAIHFETGAAYLRFAEQVAHIAEDVTRTLRERTVNALAVEKNKRMQRQCFHCRRNVMTYADAVCCDLCGTRFEVIEGQEGE